MDIERTIEFILEQQAKAEAVRMETEAARKEWEARHEREVEHIHDLIRQSNEVMLSVIDEQARTELKFQELAEAQKKTEESLRRFLDRTNGSNGRTH